MAVAPRHLPSVAASFGLRKVAGLPQLVPANAAEHLGRNLEEEDELEEIFGNPKLVAALSVVVAILCALSVSLCCIRALKRPRDEPISDVQAVEQDFWDSEEPMQRNLGHSENWSPADDADCEVQRWQSPAHSVDSDTVLAQHDELDTILPVAHQVATASSDAPCASSSALHAPAADMSSKASSSLQKDMSELRIGWVEEHVEDVQVRPEDERADANGSLELQNLPLHVSCWSSCFRGPGRTVCMVWKESGLGSLVSL